MRVVGQEGLYCERLSGRWRSEQVRPFSRTLCSSRAQGVSALTEVIQSGIDID